MMGRVCGAGVAFTYVAGCRLRTRETRAGAKLRKAGSTYQLERLHLTKDCSPRSIAIRRHDGREPSSQQVSYSIQSATSISRHRMREESVCGIDLLRMLRLILSILSICSA